MDEYGEQKRFWTREATVLHPPPETATPFRTVRFGGLLDQIGT